MSSLVVMTEEQLRALIREEVGRATGRGNDEWMTPDDVARMLGVKRSTIPSLVRREGLPCYRPGKAYTFRRCEVVAWLEARADRPGSTPGRSRGNLRALRGGKT